MLDSFHCGHSFVVLIIYTSFYPQGKYNWYIFVQLQLFSLILCFNNRSAFANRLAVLKLHTSVTF